MLKTKVDEVGGIIVLQLTGALDYRSSPQMVNFLLGLLRNDKKKVVIDLENVDHIDSTGLGALVRVKREIDKRSGHLAIGGATDSIEKMLKTTRLDEVLKLYPEVKGAVEDIKSK
jgi:anti-sigma B factor antagonist